MTRRVRGAVIAGACLLAGAFGVAIFLGNRPGEIIYAAHDGVYAIDIDRIRIAAVNPDVRGVRDLLHAGLSLWVATADGLQELDAATLVARRTLAPGIFDAVVPGRDHGELLALEHPGANPNEARDFHQLRLFDVKAGRLLHSWKLPADAHDLVRVPRSSLVHAPRQVGRRFETVDLAHLELDSVTHEIATSQTESELAQMKVMLEAPDGAGLFLFEGELAEAAGRDRQFHFWTLDASGAIGDRHPLPGLPAYPRMAAISADGMAIVATCGIELVRLDLTLGPADARPRDGQARSVRAAITRRAPLAERNFAVCFDAAGRRLIAARPTDEAKRGALLVLDALSLEAIGSLSIPTAVSELSR